MGGAWSRVPTSKNVIQQNLGKRPVCHIDEAEIRANIVLQTFFSTASEIQILQLLKMFANPRYGQNLG